MRRRHEHAAVWRAGGLPRPPREPGAQAGEALVRHALVVGDDEAAHLRRRLRRSCWGRGRSSPRSPPLVTIEQYWRDCSEMASGEDYLISECPPRYEMNVPGEVPLSVGTTMGLLLAFRLQTSYKRWWQARELWGQIIQDRHAPPPDADPDCR